MTHPQEPVDKRPDPVAAATEKPIIVSTSKEHSGKGERSVVAGSRIARKQVSEPGSIASNTPIGALSVNSGVDVLSVENRVVKRKVSQCVSDDPSIGKEAACLLIDAQTALVGEDRTTGIAIYRYLNSSEEFSTAERLVAAEKLFALGQSTTDSVLREEALLRMLATEAMTLDGAQSARRSLVTFALQRGDARLAITRLKEIVADDADDAQSYANLAILLRQENLAGASEHMMRAIEIKKAKDETIPPGWAEFIER